MTNWPTASDKKMLSGDGARSDLTFDYRKGYLYALITVPTVTRATAYEYLAEILLECSRKRCKRVMIEREFTDLENAADFFETMGELLKMNSGTKIAFVNQRIAHEDAIHYAVNARPDPDYHYFTETAVAEQWLHADT